MYMRNIGRSAVRAAYTGSFLHDKTVAVANAMGCYASAVNINE